MVLLDSVEALRQPVINGCFIAGSLVGPGGLKLIKVGRPGMLVRGCAKFWTSPGALDSGFVHRKLSNGPPEQW